MPSPTRFKVQQMWWGFYMYDSQTEQPIEGEVARFDVNLDEADLIRRQVADFSFDDDGELVVTEIVDGD